MVVGCLWGTSLFRNTPSLHTQNSHRDEWGSWVRKECRLVPRMRILMLPYVDSFDSLVAGVLKGGRNMYLPSNLNISINVMFSPQLERAVESRNLLLQASQSEIRMWTASPSVTIRPKAGGSQGVRFSFKVTSLLMFTWCNTKKAPQNQRS